MGWAGMRGMRGKCTADPRLDALLMVPSNPRLCSIMKARTEPAHPALASPRPPPLTRMADPTKYRMADPTKYRYWPPLTRSLHTISHADLTHRLSHAAPCFFPPGGPGGGPHTQPAHTFTPILSSPQVVQVVPCSLEARLQLLRRVTLNKVWTQGVDCIGAAAGGWPAFGTFSPLRPLFSLESCPCPVFPSYSARRPSAG